MKKRKPSYVACVTGQMGSERIIRFADMLASSTDAPLYVLSIMPSATSPEALEALEYLYSVATSLGAEMSVFCSANPALAAVKYISYKKISHVITGTPGEDSKGFVELVRQVLPKVSVISVPCGNIPGELCYPALACK